MSNVSTPLSSKQQKKISFSPLKKIASSTQVVISQACQFYLQLFAKRLALPDSRINKKKKKPTLGFTRLGLIPP
jgi:hypothetical protein